MTTEFMFQKQDPGNDPGKITAEISRRARFIQTTNNVDFQAALQAVFADDPVLEQKYSALGDAPTVVSWDGKSSIGSPRLEPE